MLDLGPTESWIAIALTLGLVGAGIFGGVHLVRTYWPASAESEVSEHTSNAAKNGDQPENPDAAPISTLNLPSLPENADAKTAELIGCWVSRADDGSVCIMDLQANEAAEYTGASINPDRARSLHGRWAVTKIDGANVTIDIIYSNRFEVHRVFAEQCGPDCLHVRRETYRGRMIELDQRYVRRPAPAP